MSTLVSAHRRKYDEEAQNTFSHFSLSKPTLVLRLRGRAKGEAQPHDSLLQSAPHASRPFGLTPVLATKNGGYLGQGSRCPLQASSKVWIKYPNFLPVMCTVPCGDLLDLWRPLKRLLMLAWCQNFWHIFQVYHVQDAGVDRQFSQQHQGRLRLLLHG